MSGIDSPIDWVQTQAAILTWLANATGLTVAWTKQPRAPQDGKPFATLGLLGSLRMVGADSITKKWNPVTGLIDRTISGHRDFTVQAQVFTDSVMPDSHALNYLARAQIALGMPEFINALGGSGVAIVSSNPIQDLSDIAGADWQSRASMDVIFRVAAVVAPASVPPIANVRRTLILRDGNDGQPIVVEDDE